LRIALAFAFLLVSTVPAHAAPARFLTATFSGGCDSFTIAVTGEGLQEPNAVVSYNITLTPRSGEPIAVVDSFPVTPAKDGTFRGTIRQSWEKFEYRLTAYYKLSGNVILASNLTPLHTLSISFSPKKLNCHGRSSMSNQRDMDDDVIRNSQTPSVKPSCR
jgi:hypothetical protein